jgi:RHH-type proline utilization regulon transcriptional repressor/proline dehydrogenase/delta 1-pyrroline-5-carboxylate dehydrogenase
MVRLVKGAYWDSEIKRAQVEAMPGFPLFTSRPRRMSAILPMRKKLIGYADRIYPQFATHNAQTVAAILELAATCLSNSSACMAWASGFTISC